MEEDSRRNKELIEKQKSIYYGELDHHNPKELWQRINEHRSNKAQEIIEFTPEDLNRGFLNVWEGIKSQNLTQFSTPPLDAPKDLILPNMVMYQLKPLNTNKAPGPDGIWKTNKQYGFLRNKNTMDAIVKVIDDWELAIDLGQTIHTVFFAFDLVDHTILLNKLKTFNLPNWMVPWVAQYLSGREQRVKIDEQSSSWSPVCAGVIQGSVLGPILFLLFIADINYHINDIVELIKYADDIPIYSIFKNVLVDNVQQAVDAILNRKL